MREIKIIAAAEDAGARIDKYISEQEDLSRSRVQALLAEGSILVDRKSTRLNSSHSGESRMPSSA